MNRKLVVIAVILFSTLPAFAKPHDIFPVSCDALWTAVKDVLGNTRDYSVLGISDSQHAASFVVIGELTSYKDRVALTARGSGCAMNLNISQVGPENSDEAGFRKRLNKALAKLQSSQPAKPAAPPGQN